MMPTVPPPATWAVISRAAPSGATTGLAWSCARAVVANSSVDVGHRRRNGVEQLDAIEDMVGAGGGALGGDVRPAVARLDDPQAREPKIAHGAGGHADVLAELRLDQNHNGAVERDARFGFVGARSGHHFTF